ITDRSNDRPTDQPKDGIYRQTVAVPAPPFVPHPSAEAAAPQHERAMHQKAMHQQAVQGASALSHFTDLDGLRDGLLALDNCALKHTASNLCFADGNPGADLMIIGEIPGRDEDRIGIPFAGVAGQLLDRMLASFGRDRSSSYLVNLLPWRPPGNRTPTDEELALLLPWLYRHIQLAKPSVILLLGGMPCRIVLGQKDGILKCRGRWQNIDFGDGIGRPVIASLHPAYLLRSPAQKRLAFDDLINLAGRLGTSAGPVQG
ncbi:MAG: uracil-DNA glycosylase, partial [Candidatus Puniceispirillum sp.]